ncbi:MAG: hypothetical protein ACFFKA_10325 [Candidatus Thorarchaeota archaeon]
MKIINCVFSKNKLDFKKYIKTVDCDDIISYHDIISKLIKNDINSKRPSSIVVNTYIRRKIIKSLSGEGSIKIVYALKNLEEDTVKSIKNLMFEYCEHDLEFNLIIIKNKKNDLYISNSLAEEFSEIIWEEI